MDTEWHLGVATLRRQPSIQRSHRLGTIDLSLAVAYTGDMGIPPVFDFALGLCQFGLVLQDSFREFVEAGEQRFQFPVLLRRGLIKRRR